MIFVKYLPSKKTEKTRTSMALFRCPVCEREFTKTLSNGERDRTCGKQACKDFKRHTEGTPHSIAVEQLREDGTVVRDYPSMSQAGKVMEVSNSAIPNAIKNCTRCRGFFWRKKVEESD
jgi:hypothetical protein